MCVFKGSSSAFLLPLHAPLISRIILPSFICPIWSFLLCLSLSLPVSRSETFSLFFYLSPSLKLHYLQCGNAQNCLPLLIIRCIRQGQGLVSGSDSPGASWERGREETWRGRMGEENRVGGGRVPHCPCVVWWCEVLNGSLCRITLVVCCISDITGSIALHWPTSQLLLQQDLADKHPLFSSSSFLLHCSPPLLFTPSPLPHCLLLAYCPSLSIILSHF